MCRCVEDRLDACANRNRPNQETRVVQQPLEQVQEMAVVQEVLEVPE